MWNIISSKISAVPVIKGGGNAYYRTYLTRPSLICSLQHNLNTVFIANLQIFSNLCQNISMKCNKYYS